MNTLKTNLSILYTVLTREQTCYNANFLFSFFQFSLEAQSPQLLSTEDTFPGARSKRRGFSPGAAARLSLSARAHTDSPKNNCFFFEFFELSRVWERMCV